MNLKKDRSLHRGEIILDLKKIQLIANMNHSLVRILNYLIFKQWFRTQVGQMINVKKEGENCVPDPEANIVDRNDLKVRIIFELKLVRS